MTLGRREYSDADMLRMQRDAEERVREMQNRARATVEQDNLNMPNSSPRNRNWNSNPNRRQNSRRQNPQSPTQTETPSNRQSEPAEPIPTAQEAAEHAQPEESKKTTIIEDVMGALKLDEDYLLIIGLILILVNQRADTTLILALAYLLI